MNIDKKIEKDESKQIEWEVNTRLEKRPVKLLEGKKQ